MDSILDTPVIEQRAHQQHEGEHAVRDLLDARGELDRLLARARRLGDADHGWAAFAIDARRQTRRLAARVAGACQLVVEPTDPPVVIERTLLVLSRHVDRLYAGLVTGRSAWENSITEDA